VKKQKRSIDILVISDIHLGTYGCHAKELLHYLKSIRPKQVVLNGDIIDIWQFSKSYWPKSHMKVIKHLIGWMGKGIKTYYVTGNHDEMLRKFEGLKMGALRIVNKVVLELPEGKRAWVFHGDVFDVTMQHSKWLAKLGAVGYDTLILINKFCIKLA
jgi:UDP-2,3-diacylglucosamine pyrophosphatase LpxH